MPVYPIIHPSKLQVMIINDFITDDLKTDIQDKFNDKWMGLSVDDLDILSDPLAFLEEADGKKNEESENAFDGALSQRSDQPDSNPVAKLKSL